MSFILTKPKFADLVAGFSVAVVLVPQSLAYSQLAGLPAHIGLFAAALPLIIFSIYASSPYLQIGPAALTVLITFGILTGLGYVPESSSYIAAAGLLALLVGLFRIILGTFKLGWASYLICQPVMYGFTTAAAVLIFCSQLPKALGVNLVVPDGDTISKAFWSITNIGEWNLSSVLIALFTLAAMLGGPKVHKIFPGVLIAVLSGLALSKIGISNGPTVGEPTSIPEGLPSLSLSFPWEQVVNLSFGALIIAIIGFVGPSAIARTFADEEQQNWDPNKELIASGSANLMAAFSGSFPVSGSLSRTSLNKLSGAMTTWSARFTGLAVLCFLPVASVLDDLPQAVLGGILLGASIKLIKFKILTEIVSVSKPEALLMFSTFIATLMASPNIHWGVLFGFLATLVLHQYNPGRVKASEENIVVIEGLIWHLSEKDVIAQIIKLAKQNQQNQLKIDFTKIAVVENLFLNKLAKDLSDKNYSISTIGLDTNKQNYFINQLSND